MVCRPQSVTRLAAADFATDLDASVSKTSVQVLALRRQ